MKKLFLSFLAWGILGSNLTGASTNYNPLGFWFSEERRAKIQLFNCGESKICGKIVALKEPLDPETKQPKLDKHNPNAGESHKPVVGLVNVKNFVLEEPGKNKWSGGEIYDPKEGKTYSAYFTMESNTKLLFTGYVLGIEAFGRTQEWERTTEDSPF